MSRAAERAIERIRDLVSGSGPRPIAEAVHVGSAEAQHLLGEAAGWKHAAGSFSTIYGVRVVVWTAQDAAPLGELGWRVVDPQGETLASGDLE